MSTPMNTTQSIVQSPVCLCVCLCARLLACHFACLHALLLACMHETELTDCTVKALIDSLHHADHFWCYQQSGPLCDCPPSPPHRGGGRSRVFCLGLSPPSVFQQRLVECRPINGDSGHPQPTNSSEQLQLRLAAPDLCVIADMTAALPLSLSDTRPRPKALRC